MSEREPCEVCRKLATLQSGQCAGCDKDDERVQEYREEIRSSYFVRCKDDPDHAGEM